MKRTKNRCVGILLILFFAFCGLRGVFVVFEDNILLIESRHWATTRATIDELHIEQGGAKGTDYFPKVKYHFDVNGVDYLGNRLDIPEIGKTRSEAIDLASHYTHDTNVTVLYDTSDPSWNVLRRPEMNYWFTFGFGGISLLFITWSIWVTVLMIRDIHRFKNS